MFMNGVYFVFALLVLILFHELGHFLVAKLCGVKVLRFSFGFGKVLFSWRDKSGTEYSWSLLPLGGYVKMLDENLEEFSVSDSQYSLNNKPFWMKSAIVLAGPVFNFILAFIFLFFVYLIGFKSIAPIIGNVKEHGLAANIGFKTQQEIIAVNERDIKTWHDFQYAIVPYMYNNTPSVITVKSRIDGSKLNINLPSLQFNKDNNAYDFFNVFEFKPYIPKISTTIGEIDKDTPAYNSGLKAGDIIVAILNKPVHDWRQVVKFIKNNPDSKVSITVKRGLDKINYLVTIGHIKKSGKITGFLGVRSIPVNLPKDYLRTVNYPFFKAANLAIIDCLVLCKTTGILFGKMLVGKVSLDTLSGPVGIAKGAASSASMGFASYFSFIAMLSIGLCVLNLLPIPMLDGGHLFFYILEAILGKPISQKTRMKGAYIGIFLLVTLTVVALTNDLVKIFGA